MAGKLVLIDGNSIINRAFYGVPMLTNAEGIHTNAVYGFLNIMFRIMDEENPQYLAIAFDLKAPTFRHKMYKEYKGTRKPMPEELREQVPILKELLKKMQVCIVEKEGYEADDILGTLARRGEKDGYDVALISGDRDLLQIATDKIKIRIPKTIKGKTDIEDYYTQDVINKYGLKPLQIIELKALMGDSSDNIPGVPKIGEKTATELLLQYENIETLKEHIQDITKKSIRESLENNFDMAVMSKELATICTSAPIDIEIQDTEIKNMFTSEAYEEIKRLGFKKMLAKFANEDNNSTTLQAEIISLTDLSELGKLMEQVGEREYVGFTLVNTDENSVGLSICFDNNEIYYVKPEGFLTSEYICSTLEDAIVKNLGKTVFVTYGLKQQLHTLKNVADIDYVSAFFDIELAKYLINPLLKDYSSDLKDELVSYAAFTEYKEMTDKLDSMEMLKLYYDIELPLVFALYEMEKWGIRVKADELKEYGGKLEAEIKTLEEAIHEAAGCDFNINSPKQLGEVLFERLGIEGGKKTKTGYSTSADVLEKLAPEHKIVEDILKYRGLAKLKSTYVDGLFPCIADDSRIHSTFHQTITATGRISSAEPNLQNIPVREEQGRLIRKVFVPEDGYIFVDADYSQIELRILAHMSDDEKLIAAYNREEDIHRITASEVFNVPFEEVTPLQRRNAKAVNFGIIYGISSFGLSQDLSISVKDAKTYIANYFKTYPAIKAFIDGLVENAKKDGYVTTLYGRRRPVPELQSSNFMQRSFGERVAMNAPIQGTAADVMKLAMINVLRRLKKEGLKSRLILQVHDELLIETLKEEKDIVEKLLVEEMEKAANLRVELKAEPNSGTDWYEAK